MKTFKLLEFNHTFQSSPGCRHWFCFLAWDPKGVLRIGVGALGLQALTLGCIWIVFAEAFRTKGPLKGFYGPYIPDYCAYNNRTWYMASI